MDLTNMNRPLIRAIKDCRTAHEHAPTKINGREAWICLAPWGLGVRYYPINEINKGQTDNTPNGVITILERL